MVGILIVSHSKEIADGAKKLARQMGGDSVPLEAVGGTKDGRLGTDPNAIQEALDSLSQGDGVVVLADMGSAVMNVEMAFEFFPEEVQKKFKIANAPVVEGAISAVLQARAGKDITEILTFMEEEENFSQKVNR